MKRTPHGQLARFRIYPEKGTSRLYFDVRVFASVVAIRRYLKHHELIPRAMGRYGVAMCSGWSEVYKTSGHLTPRIGEILFCKRWFGAGVIAHECTHAAIFWAERIRLNPLEPKAPRRGTSRQRFAGPHEERFCYGLGDMVRQIAAQAWKRGLVK